MPSKHEFVARFKNHIAGLALFGTISEMKDGPMKRAERIFEIPAEVERLLGQMYDYLLSAAEKPTNGHSQPVAAPGPARAAPGKPGALPADGR